MDPTDPKITLSQCSSSQTRCLSQLSPSAPPTALSRCSSASAHDQCPYSRLSCGSLSPICSNTNNEVKIFITDPQNNSVFSSVHDPPFKPTQEPNPSILSISSLFTSINNGLMQPWSRLVILLWAVLSPVVLGLFIGLTIGWTNLPGRAISIGLLFASASILVCSLITSSLWRFGSNIRRRSLYQTLPGDNTSACLETCTSPDTEKENCLINCAEKKISRTQFFTVDK
eukprot:GFUD01113411.1.p1 GENE.GFUD01113411.1~~GFUD01113411.1.p1  ORF type:complete len:228 (+),score=29.88 GFUD01113411.1:66-749(+)